MPRKGRKFARDATRAAGRAKGMYNCRFFVGQPPSERSNTRIRCKNIGEEAVNFALQFLSGNGIFRGAISYVFDVKELTNP
jgi:hypothetical protein